MIARAAAWSSAEVAAAVGGEHHGAPDVPLAGVATDTRDAVAGHLFVALVGARHDAHDHLAAAVAGGAGALLVSRAGLERARAAVASVARSVPLVVVEDTLAGLGDLGRAHRRRWGGPVLALTGSNGKTTTKELLASILATRRATLRTEGNLNNLVGVPLTLLGVSPGHEVAVVEMGMNRRGEIARYAEIAEPDVGLVINIGPAHIGELGSIEAIACAKGELFHGLAPGAAAVANLDDPRVMQQAALAGLRPRTFGRSPGADVRLVSAAPLSLDGALEGQRLALEVDGRAIEATLPMAGAHCALDAAAAVATATALPSRLPVSLDDVVAGLAAAASLGGRQQVRRLGPWLVIDDAYNANPASMLASIAMAQDRARREGRRLVVLLGEMRELGEFSEEGHAEVGHALAGAALAGVLGGLAGPLARAAREAGVTTFFDAADDAALWAEVRPRLSPGDLVLVKGSRGIRMERFVDRLAAEA